MSFPLCMIYRLEVIAKKVRIAKKDALIQKLMAYWTLKRQSRNGVPLVRRLQSTHSSQSNKPPEKVIYKTQYPAINCDPIFLCSVTNNCQYSITIWLVIWL